MWLMSGCLKGISHALLVFVSLCVYGVLRVLLVRLPVLLSNAFVVVLVPKEVMRNIGVGWLSKWISSNVMAI